MLDNVRRDPKHEGEQREDRVVRCKACEAEVAKVDDRVAIGLGDLHTFVNPSGEVFEVACYARADGAAAVGVPTLEYTWFPGYAWRFAHCRSCGHQLGWRYDSDGGGFWGLTRRATR